MLKAITLWNPWAALMAIGAKINETRSIRTHYRGDIAIHAARKPVKDVLPAVLNAFRDRAEPIAWHPGCIVAIVELYDVVPSENFFPIEWCNRTPKLTSKAEAFGGIPIHKEEFLFGDYMPGRFVFRTRNLRRIKNPVQAHGCHAIHWTLPLDIEANVRGQLY